MRLVLILLTTMGIVSAQTIATKVLTPGTPIKISLSPALTTTLLCQGSCQERLGSDCCRKQPPSRPVAARFRSNTRTYHRSLFSMR